MPILALPPEHVTNGQLYTALLTVVRQQQDIYRKQVEQSGTISELRRDFESQVKKQQDMIDAWTAAKGTLGFLKLIASIGLPIGAVLAWIFHRS